jgi:periplasmic divalent cation tolerance protein
MPDQPPLMIVVSTAPEHAAFDISHALLNERLVACINLIPVRSMYWWDEKFCTERELLMMMKTTPEKFTEVEKRICALHPYDVPEVLGFPVSHGAEQYLNWVLQSVVSDRPDDLG